MADMSFFEKMIRYQDKITLPDLLSGAKAKHTKQDRENILLTGTFIDAAATESVMLQKWQMPWFFLRVLIVGLVFSAMLIACMLFTGNVGHGRKFCVSDIRQSQGWRCGNRANLGLKPFLTTCPGGRGGMRAACGVNAALAAGIC